MDIGILGTGKMGGTLGRLLAAKGHKVVLGTRDTKAAEQHFKNIPNCIVVSQQEAVNFGKVVILATPWPVTEEIVSDFSGWDGKFVVDITNPLSPDISYLMVSGNTSAAERIAERIPTAFVVKAFNSINAANLGQPTFSGEPAQLFYCGDNEDARNAVAELIDDLGFIPVCCGELTNARYLEAVAMLWIQMAFVGGYGMSWSFKVIRRTDSA